MSEIERDKERETERRRERESETRRGRQRGGEIEGSGRTREGDKIQRIKRVNVKRSF